MMDNTELLELVHGLSSGVEKACGATEERMADNGDDTHIEIPVSALQAILGMLRMQNKALNSFVELHMVTLDKIEELSRD